MPTLLTVVVAVLALTAAPPPTLLDAAEVAERLGLTIRWMRRAIAGRRLPIVKVGRYVRVDPLAFGGAVGHDPFGPREADPAGLHLLRQVQRLLLCVRLFGVQAVPTSRGDSSPMRLVLGKAPPGPRRGWGAQTASCRHGRRPPLRSPPVRHPGDACRPRRAAHRAVQRVAVGHRLVVAGVWSRSGGCVWAISKGLS